MHKNSAKDKSVTNSNTNLPTVTNNNSLSLYYQDTPQDIMEQLSAVKTPCYLSQLPKKLWPYVYRISGAPIGQALCIRYQGYIMDRYTAAALLYMDSIRQGAPITLEQALQVKDDNGVGAFAEPAGGRDISKYINSLQRIIDRSYGEMGVTRDELLEHLWKMLKEGKIVYANAGYDIDENGGKVFKKKEMRVQLNPKEQKEIVELMGKLSGLIGEKGSEVSLGGMGKVSLPSGTMGEVTFRWKDGQGGS